MNVIGIIAEYNPFHNGHAYQIAHVRKNLHADYIVVATSGDYVQRGEPALLDKYTRARMALSSGADVVLELPVLWSTASAELFADAGISLFEKTGCVNGICFGAESGDLALLRRIADVLADEPTDLKASLKYNLKSGSTFPKAREAALLSYFSGSAGQDGALPVSAEALSSLLASPNNILALEYLKALRRRASSITPYLLKREGAAYHETSILSGASAIPASASAIRHTLFADAAGACGNSADRASEDSADGILRHAMPQEALAILQDYRADFPLLCADDFSGILGYLLLSSSATQLARTADSSPEFANRMQNQLPYYTSFSSFASRLKSKEMTLTRINRILLHSILGITSSDYACGNALDKIPYLRILGFRKSAAPLLAALKASAAVPLITRSSQTLKLLSPDAMRVFEHDVFAGNLYLQMRNQKGGTPLRAARMQEHDVPPASEYQRQIIILP
ncbi:MAG TPA: nucleotidyltransferase [Roseburia sp.]|nr:nucleotidyltransferase [Roseburia sp.]